MWDLEQIRGHDEAILIYSDELQLMWPLLEIDLYSVYYDIIYDI